VTGVARYLVRVRLLDRPGALGLVASRIGAVGGDIVAVDILERENGMAIDEFVIELGSDELVELLRREVHEVDGARVESVRLLERPPAGDAGRPAVGEE
jgi:ACT domain-containing protein